jgi:hypothetical protein
MTTRRRFISIVAGAPAALAKTPVAVAASDARIGFESGTLRAAGAALPRPRLAAVDFSETRESGIGRGLGILAYKDLLAALQDATRLVHVVHGPGVRGREAAEIDSHRAALRVAAANQARAVLWGRATEIGEAIALDTSLSLATTPDDGSLTVQIAFAGMPIPDVAAELPWTRFDFGPSVAPRTQILNRTAVAGPGGAALRVAPEAAAGILRTARAGEAVQIRDMKEEWFILQEGGRPLYVDGKPRDAGAGLLLTPRRVTLEMDWDPRAEPNTNARAVARAEANRAYTVLGRRLVGDQSWIELDLGGRRGWAPQRRSHAVADLGSIAFATAAMHFISGEFASAERAFRAFLARSDAERVHIVAAAAHQFLAVTSLRLGKPGELPTGIALMLLDRAVALTPLDPGALALRALVTIADVDGRGARSAIDDLERALGIDPYNGRARVLAGAIARAANSDALDMRRALALDDPALRTRLSALVRRFGGRESAGGSRRLSDDLQNLFRNPR